MKVLYLAAEATPLIKAGGLADVAGELPPALRALDVDIRLAMPFYPSLNQDDITPEVVAKVKIPHTQGPQEGTIYQAEIRGTPVFLVDGEVVRESESIYRDPESDTAKFAFTCLAALSTCEAVNWQPDIVHANDWHMALAIVQLNYQRKKAGFWRDVVTILTIHNLPYMGSGGQRILAEYGFKPSDDPGLPPWARDIPLPMGLAAADWITTVSTSYAQEIQTPEFGSGLDGFLTSRSGRLIGILNGIDPRIWDPSHDNDLPFNFSSQELSPRAGVRLALQTEVGLPGDQRVPLLGMVTRLNYQKGIDLVFEALKDMRDEPWQLVLLGSGDSGVEDQAREFAYSSPERIRIFLRFDEVLARRIYGGSDIMLIPSRYEPGGLAQLIALRYGSVPIVRATGGLKDSVEEYRLGGMGTGFLFGPAESQALKKAIQRSLSVRADGRKWKALQRRGMTKDFSWESSSRRYLTLYREALSQKRR